MGADSAAARLVLGADFNCSQRDFSAVFQRNFRAEKEKRGRELMLQIVRKPMNYKNKTKNEGAALDPPCSGAGKPQGGKPP